MIKFYRETEDVKRLDGTRLMTNTKGQKPAAIRDTNIKLIMSLLEEKSRCRSDLAKTARLSNPALTMIIDELLNMGIIKEGAEIETNLRGRRKVDLVLNNRFAAVAAIDFSSDNIQIAIADFVKETVLRREIADSEIITREVLTEVVKTLRDMIARTDIPVKCICVGVPGKINTVTGKVHMATYKYRDCSDVNIVELFETEFGIPTVLANDASLQMLAEKRGGSDADSALLYIDYGMGGALWLHGRNFEGDRGLAAELGAVPLIMGDGITIYEDVCGINAMLGASGYVPDNSASYKKFVEAFLSGGEKETAAVEKSAHGVALLIRCILGITGCSDVIISGKIRQLGEAYLKSIKKYLKEEKIFDISLINVRYGKFSDNGTLAGAIDKAVAHVIDVAVSER